MYYGVMIVQWKRTTKNRALGEAGDWIGRPSFQNEMASMSLTLDTQFYWLPKKKPLNLGEKKKYSINSVRNDVCFYG